MKLAATHAIAALAKRPPMRRRPSAGDLLRLADAAQSSVAAGAGAPSKQEPPAVNGTATAASNGTAGKAESEVSSSTLSTDMAATTAAAAGGAGSEASSSAQPVSSPFKQTQQQHQHQHHHTRSSSTGKPGHARRKSYGEGTGPTWVVHTAATPGSL